MASLKWVCSLACLVGLAVPSLDCAPSPGEKTRLADLECYLVQMHIHGHSNHNGNDLPASMESHCAEAERCGFDVIWWTDHAQLFSSYDDIRIDFQTAFVDSGADAVVFGEGRGRELTCFYLKSSGRGCRIEVKDGRLLVDVESGQGSSGFAQVVLTLGSDRGKVHTIEYCRPVTSGLRLDVWGDAEGLGSDTYLRFGFDFSVHPKGQHHARNDVVRGVGAGATVIGDTAVVWESENTHFGKLVSVDMERIVAPLPNGDDNTLSSTWIEIGARNGQTISLALDSLVFSSTRPTGENQYEVAEGLSRRYEHAYGVTQYTGVEIGLFHTPRLPHMNAYFPDSMQTYESVSMDREIRREVWVEQVHRRGGLVSLNHPFGASLIPKRKADAYHPAGLSIRDLSKAGTSATDDDFWDVAKPIVEEDGLGADILEVGYLFRGIGSLEDHLRLWDLALANGVRLVGNGATDSHGGTWGPDMVPNPFASWVWARSKDADDLLKALKAGRVTFGDPFLWRGKLAFGVEDAMMGDTLLVDRGGLVQAWIHMEPWRSDVRIKLVQTEIKKGKDLTVIRDEFIEYDRQGVPVKVDRACFVRAEIHSNDGNPLIFTNPVFLIPR